MSNLFFFFSFLVDFSLKQAHTSLVSPAFKSSVNKLEASLIPTSFPFLFFVLLLHFSFCFLKIQGRASKGSGCSPSAGAAGQLLP